MSVSINNVYQQVLAISNKEQRGYITPQEFNLFARKAQNEIFESTFQDYKDAYLNSEQFIGQHNSLYMLKEKMNPFKVEDNAVTVTSGVGEISLTAGTSVYWIENVHDLDGQHVFEEVTKQELNYLKDYFSDNAFPLNIENIVLSDNLKFISKNSFYRKSDGKLVFYPLASSGITPLVDFIRPITDFDDPKWGYVVVNNKALYNSNTSKNFVLHSSEESSLVNKIIELAGISMTNPFLVQSAATNEQMNKADKNN